MENLIFDEMPFHCLTDAEFEDLLSAIAWHVTFDNSVLGDHINSLCKTDILKHLNFKYLSEDQFNAQYGNDVHFELGLFHVNIESLNSNADRLCQFYLSTLMLLYYLKYRPQTSTFI
jgi:hypothetical protein